MSKGHILIVDDDAAMRDALTTIFELEGYEVRCFEDGASFIAEAHRLDPIAVFLDVHMPGQSGIDVLEQLPAVSYGAPIFVISGQGDIPMAVAALKKGAYDFIEKPFGADIVLDAIESACDAQSSCVETDEGTSLEVLTKRENQIMRELIKGRSNKEIARDLSISPRTVEVHRARVLEKAGARNVADLVRIVLQAS